MDSAKLATAISGTDLADLERQLTFSLRDAFVRTLQAKSVLELAEENINAYDKVIEISRRRFEAGDLSRSDFDRIGLQRSQFESDLENAKVNLRTAKIQILALLNDKTPVDQFDVTGPFAFGDQLLLAEELHQVAETARGDVLSATTALKKAEVDHRLAVANGSTDPTVGADYTRIGPANTVGVAVSVPLRVFDKNQGEKLRTELDMNARPAIPRRAAGIGLRRYRFGAGHGGQRARPAASVSRPLPPPGRAGAGIGQLCLLQGRRDTARFSRRARSRIATRNSPIAT